MDSNTINSVEDNLYTRQQVNNIKHDMKKQQEFMQTRADLSPVQVLELIDYYDNLVSELSTQIVNLIASKGSCYKMDEIRHIQNQASSLRKLKQDNN